MYELLERNGRAYYKDYAEHIELSIPAEDCIGLLSAKGLPPAADFSIFEAEVRHPSYGPSIKELVEQRNAKNASLIVSDATRHVPTNIVVPHMIHELIDAGIKAEDILIVVALGVHRLATGDEIKEFVGDEYYGRVRVENPQPYNEETLINLGTTKYGTPVAVNRHAYECDLHMSVGKVEPHCFAGYSGGRKSVLPGISGARTIIRNHCFENVSSDLAIPGRLENNPIHLDMVEAANLYRIDFTVQLLVTEDLQPAAVFAGELERAHIAAVEYLRPNLTVRIPEKPDIIVTTPGKPKNICFYQGINPLVSLTPFVDQNTVVVLTCEAPEGIDSVDMQYPFKNTSSLEEMEPFMQANYRIQMDSALLLLKMLRKGTKIILHSPNITDEEIMEMYMTPCSDPSKLMELAYKMCGKEHPRVLFYPHPHTDLQVM